MSLGGAVMILSERLTDRPGGSVLFMLAMLEVGSVALLVAIIIMALPAHGLGFHGLRPGRRAGHRAGIGRRVCS